MLRHIGETAMANRIMTALGTVLEGKVRTRDLGGTAGRGSSRTICRQLETSAATPNWAAGSGIVLRNR